MPSSSAACRIEIARLGEHPHDLVALERLDPGQPVRGAGEHVRRQVADVDHVGARRGLAGRRCSSCATFPGQRVARAARASAAGVSADLAAARPAGGVPGQRDDVVGPLPQRRHSTTVSTSAASGAGTAANVRRRSAANGIGRRRSPGACRRVRQDQVAQPLGGPGRQPVRRRATTTAVSGLPSSGVHSASQASTSCGAGALAERIRSRGLRRRTPAPAAWPGRHPARRRRRRPGRRPARARLAPGRRARRRDEGRQAARLRPWRSRPGTPRRAGRAAAAGPATGRASAPRCCRRPTGPGPAAGRWTTSTRW